MDLKFNLTQFYALFTLIAFISYSVPASSWSLRDNNVREGVADRIAESPLSLLHRNRPDRHLASTGLSHHLIRSRPTISTSTSQRPWHPMPIPNSASSFKVCDKTPEKVTLGKYPDSSNNLVTYLQEYKKNRCTRVIQGTDFGKGHIEPSRKNGFISTVIQCYNGHHNLVIRPDDIWTAIISQFSLYINANAERFRGRFVNFDDKKTLTVDLGYGTLDSVSYSEFVRLMTDEIHKNIVDEEVKNWIMPNFTTTTQDDKITAGVVFMATLKKYFNYVGTIACGIPRITLEGTVDDWKNIAARLTKLRSYKLEDWVDGMLQPILQQFIRAKSGDIDQEFWNSIVKVETVGCGSTDISGWITAFSVFNDEGKWRAYVPEGRKWAQMDIESIVSGVVHVDVVIDDNGTKYDTVMFAGHLGKEILPDGYTLQPKIGWAIALKNTTKSDQRQENMDDWSYWGY